MVKHTGSIEQYLTAWSFDRHFKTIALHSWG